MNIYEKNPSFKGKLSFKKNDVIFAKDTDTALPKAEKNNKITKTNHKKIENQMNHSISTRKKIEIYPTKTFKVIVQENHFQITQNTLDNSHFIIRIIEEDHQIKEIHKISHKTDIVDQIVEIVDIEITIQDQTQTNLNFCLMLFPIGILEKEVIQIIDLEIFHIIEIDIFPTIVIETIQMIEILDVKIIDHAIFLTTDQKIIIINIDYAIIHRTEFQLITTDKKLRSVTT